MDGSAHRPAIVRATAPAIAGGVVYVGVNSAVEAIPAAGCGARTCPSLVSLPLAQDASFVTVADGKLFVTTGDTIDDSRNRVAVFAPAGDP